MALFGSAALAACVADQPGGDGAPGTAALAPAAVAGSETAPPPPGPGQPTALPAGSPALFGFGSAASPERIARWDIDVKPDGEGLPPGSGSVAGGRRVYEARCAACHGLSGTEGPNERLASAGAWEQWPADRAVGGYWPYATTLFDYTRKAMPQDAPGSLSDNETYAVVAYVLRLNGLVSADAVLDSAALASIRMPARGRFVPDDRTGGPAIR